MNDSALSIRHVGTTVSGSGSWCRSISGNIRGNLRLFGAQSPLLKPKTVEALVTKNKIHQSAVHMHKSTNYTRFQVRISATCVCVVCL